MRLALFADLHANLEAVTACLDHAHVQGAERFVFLGDLVGYNADPAAVVDLVRAHAETGAVVIRGNHDDAAAGGPLDEMNEAAAAAIRWSRQQLDAGQLAFLAGLPLIVREDDRCYVHASVDAPGRWAYVYDGLRAADSMAAAGTTYVFSGHVHEPTLYFLGTDRRPQPFEPVAGAPIPVAGHRRWLAIVGSCGQPRDGRPAACYALFDAVRRELTFHRVPYDCEAAARKVLAAGLPAEFARRLVTGA